MPQTALCELTVAGDTEEIAQMEADVALAAQYDVPVLITGPGRFRTIRIARQIHEGSSRAARAFLQRRCEALWDDGPAMAGGGTVFLSKIDQLDLMAQDRLSFWLSAMCQGKGTMGSPGTNRMRLIVGSESDLFAAVQAGRFRGDLYYRLNVISVRVPRAF